jgi:rhodanese-related sulfurtransferase
MTDLIYAGDLSPEESWALLNSDPDAQLFDVRTDAEFAYVGLPDVNAIGKELRLICWQVFPSMNVNINFELEVEALGFNKDQALLFLCRSGVRSRSAAHAMTARGYTRCYNVTEGFEGDKDDAKHRGNVNGWKVRGLPWTQG